MGGKRFTIILILAFVLLFPTSCQRPEPPEEGFTIGVSYDTSGFFPTSWVEALEREAEKEGIHVISICADSSTQKQISDIELLIARKPDVIIVRPNHPEGILLPLEYIRQAEIPCILLDFEIAEGYESYYDVLLKDDATAEGMVQADYIKGWLAENPGREAKIGYISGPYDGPASLKRRDALYREMGIEKAVAEEEGNWNTARAMSIVERWLQTHPEINVFACMNDSMALGVVQALAAAGKDQEDYLVLGVDGNDQYFNEIRSGALDCTAARDLEIEAQTAITVARGLSRGEQFDKIIYPDSIFALTKENINEYKKGR